MSHRSRPWPFRSPRTQTVVLTLRPRGPRRSRLRLLRWLQKKGLRTRPRGPHTHRPLSTRTPKRPGSPRSWFPFLGAMVTVERVMVEVEVLIVEELVVMVQELVVMVVELVVMVEEWVVMVEELVVMVEVKVVTMGVE